jgi:hypothetical protein
MACRLWWKARVIYWKNCSRLLKRVVLSTLDFLLDKASPAVKQEQSELTAEAIHPKAVVRISVSWLLTDVGHIAQEGRDRLGAEPRKWCPEAVTFVANKREL